MKEFCYECDSEQEVTVESKKEFFTIKEKVIEVVSDIMTCTVCGEEIFNKELDEKNMARVYQKY
ncbi:YgiT-type zinc finger protein [Desulfosporosinus sp.]|uniref:YgiT-type zinc finger protein n=1 Tax=Desulfosporosinus sp. TaxID=157907 RepID=UPI002310AA05|nr:YgiT-type zinc finger protein [Desulfosporosinus sp.]MDA8222505.1 YgiT-type zinc finger protein [Desulfitobacterium hafniense]